PGTGVRELRIRRSGARVPARGARRVGRGCRLLQRRLWPLGRCAHRLRPQRRTRPPLHPRPPSQAPRRQLPPLLPPPPGGRRGTPRRLTIEKRVDLAAPSTTRLGEATRP